MSQHEHVVPQLDGTSVEMGPLGRRIAVGAGTVGVVALAAAAGAGRWRPATACATSRSATW